MILAIESSCDDSSVAVVNTSDFSLVYYEKISQESEHAKYGGVVPELAARLHTKALPDIVLNAKPYFSHLKAVAVTSEPGLSVSLLPGIVAAKSLALSLDLPIIAINHLIGHIYSLFLDSKVLLPLGVLLVSGGHTMVLDIDANGEISVLCATSDDSFGESFDKCAKMLGLGYPGGVEIENLAKNGEPKYNFTIPLKHTKRLEYSFSGLKNQVRLEIEKCGACINYEQKANIACSFEKTACEHIIDRLELVFSEKKWKNFGVVGGASANLFLRKELEKICAKYDSNLLLAPLKYCSDNAYMIARAAVAKYHKNDFCDGFNVEMKPRSDINKILIN